MCKERLVGLLLVILAMTGSAWAVLPELSDPTIIGYSETWGSNPANVFDNSLSTQWESGNVGVGTHIDFDFGTSMPIGGFKSVMTYWDVYSHKAADLIFSNNSDFSNPVATISLLRPDTLGWALETGETNATRVVEFLHVVTARYVKYVVTQITYGPPDYTGGDRGFVGLTEMAFLAAPETASTPTPANGSVAGKSTVLSWSAGRNAVSHDVYFGTNQTTVTDATRANPQSVLLSQGQTGTTFVPTLALSATYYWRIDEVNGDSSITKGDIWTFSVVADGNELPDPAIIGYSTTWWGSPTYVFDNDLGTNWESGNVGVGTHIDLDFGAPTAIAGFMSVMSYWDVYSHRAANLIFSNNSDFSSPVATISLLRPDTLGWALETGIANAKRTVEFSSPITAQYARYIITQISYGPPDYMGGDRGFSGLTEMAFLDVTTYGATSPSPAANALVEANSVLSWTHGKDAVLHDVYIGTNEAAVTDATRTIPQGVLVSQGQTGTTYYPTLAQGTKYYWRIDEVKADSSITKGNIWSFECYTQGAWRELPDPAITGYATPYDSVAANVFDNDAGTWYSSVNLGVDTYIDFDFGQVTTIAGFKHIQVDYTGYAVTHSNLIFSNNSDFSGPVATIPMNHGLTGTAQGLDLATAITGFAPVSARYVKWDVTGILCPPPTWPDNGFVGAAEIAFLQFPQEAYFATPSNNAVDVHPDVVLTWLAGKDAVLHDVYLGTNEAAVTDATRTIPQGVLLSQGQAGTTYDPTLQRGVTYYWRIDEVKADSSIIKSNVWKFTVRTYTSVEDFEYSSPGDFNSVWTPNGAVSSLETVVARYSRGAMKLNYNNTASQHTETTRNAGFANWTADNVKSLTVYFRGAVSNSAENIYIRLSSTSASATVNYGTPDDLLSSGWTEWNIDLQQFTGVNLSDVKTITLGVSDLGSNGGSGVVYFDDIRLYPARCIPSLSLQNGDFNGDCAVNFKDMAMLAEQWLVKAPAASELLPSQSHLLGWWKFDTGSGSVAVDSSGKNNNGTIDGPAWVNDSVRGWCLSFASAHYDVVDISGSALSSLDKQVTVAFWQYGGSAQPQNNRIFEASDSSFNPVFTCRLPWTNGVVYWDAGGEAYLNGGERIFTAELPASSYMGKWNHWAFIKNVDDTMMQIYLNGAVVAEANSNGGWHPGDGTKTITGITSLVIGADRYWAANYDGMISDFRVYDYALSKNEVLSVMMNGTGTIPFAPDLAVFDRNEDGVINFKDLAIMVDSWLEEQFFPLP